MPTEIIDGHGSGKRAKVNGKGQLEVRAITETQEHRISQELEDAYFISVGLTLDSLTFATLNDGIALFLQSLSTDKILVVEKIIASADVAGGLIRFVRNYTVGTLTQNTPVVPANMNFSSTRTAPVNAEIWNEAGGNGIQGLTAGQTFKTFFVAAGPNVFPIDGVPVLDQNDNIGIEFKNPTGGPIEFEVGIRFYFEELNGG